MQKNQSRIVQLLIDGQWRPGASGETRPIHNPANEEEVGHLTCACESDLEEAAQSALRGFDIWSRTAASERSVVLARAATLPKDELEAVSHAITSEQGKPISRRAWR